MNQAAHSGAAPINIDIVQEKGTRGLNPFDTQESQGSKRRAVGRASDTKVSNLRCLACTRGATKAFLLRLKSLGRELKHMRNDCIDTHRG